MLTLFANVRWYLIGGAFLALGLYAGIQRERAQDFRAELDACIAQRELYATNLRQLQYLSNEQEKKLGTADVEIEKLRKEIASSVEGMRKQAVPVKCDAAVAWAIKNKGDLTWSK